jgi:hypothetical protein
VAALRDEATLHTDEDAREPRVVGRVNTLRIRAYGTALRSDDRSNSTMSDDHVRYARLSCRHSSPSSGSTRVLSERT